ncbi:MAG TPA: hypothetical protein PKA93_08755 [Arachnia sp.]|nr:hypothetical protein [Arachnia sp.]
MARVEKLVAEMHRTPKGVRFADLARVCNHYFGEPRQQDTSHRVYRMPWQRDHE